MELLSCLCILILLVNISCVRKVILQSLPDPIVPDKDQCAQLAVHERFDCFPQEEATEEKCLARGCCWETYGMSIGSPFCFYPSSYGGYKLKCNMDNSAVYERIFNSTYPKDITTLKITAYSISKNCLNIQIVDANADRYEPPFPELQPVNYTESDLNVTYLDPFGFQVYRKKDGTVIFDTKEMGGFIYSDQFLQISSRLMQGARLYGIGQRDGRLEIKTDEWKNFVLFNNDHFPEEGVNLYGSEPYYMAMEPTGDSHGVLLLNSNAMEIIVQPTPAITFRTIGGILNFYFFTGVSSPRDIVSSLYTDVVGMPTMPSFWSLGFHLCRFKILTLNRTKEIFYNNTRHGVPIEAQWSDIDYMNNFNDFTYDKDKFAGLPEFIQELKALDVKWVPILDPGVSGSEDKGTYLPYDLGVEMDIFVKDYKGDILVGKVWNLESTVFPDYTHPNASNYWLRLLTDMHDVMEFDGIWLDMNEPSNFVAGSKNGCPEDSSLEHPKYQPPVNGGLLYGKTLCMTAQHYLGNHYDLHNVYGSMQVQVTYKALQALNISRPFILSRTSFIGLGKYASNWNGDARSTWTHLRSSITQLLSYSMFGIPNFGVDICGFGYDTTIELCTRWHQVGAFYPFCRNHNSENSKDQDPASLGGTVLEAAVTYLRIRYSLLNNLYTLFYFANKNGLPIVEPLFFRFPNDSETYGVEYQFLWRDRLMVIPVIEESQTEVKAYLPKGNWYDFYTGELYNSSGKYYELEAPINSIPLLIPGGAMLLIQEPANTTTLTRKNPLDLLIAMDEDSTASGEFYFDDGESVLEFANGTLYNVLATLKVIKFLVAEGERQQCKNVNTTIENIIIYGWPTPVAKIVLGDRSLEFDNDFNRKLLKIKGVNNVLGVFQIDISEETNQVMVYE